MSPRTARTTPHAARARHTTPAATTCIMSPVAAQEELAQEKLNESVMDVLLGFLLAFIILASMQSETMPSTLALTPEDADTLARAFRAVPAEPATVPVLKLAATVPLGAVAGSLAVLAGFFTALAAYRR